MSHFARKAARPVAGYVDSVPPTTRSLSKEPTTVADHLVIHQHVDDATLARSNSAGPMQDAGTFKIEWTLSESGTRIVRCRELPDYTIAISPEQDLAERIRSSLQHYLAWRYGVNAALEHETNVSHFRCRIAA